MAAQRIKARYLYIRFSKHMIENEVAYHLLQDLSHQLKYCAEVGTPIIIVHADCLPALTGSQQASERQNLYHSGWCYIDDFQLLKAASVTDPPSPSIPKLISPQPLHRLPVQTHQNLHSLPL